MQQKFTYSFSGFSLQFALIANSCNIMSVILCKEGKFWRRGIGNYFQRKLELVYIRMHFPSNPTLDVEKSKQTVLRKWKVAFYLTLYVSFFMFTTWQTLLSFKFYSRKFANLVQFCNYHNIVWVIDPVKFEK